MNPHTEETHARVALARAGQALPQGPQLFGSELVSTHWPLHLTCVPGQADMQLPAEQTWLAVQTCPHWPQF